MRKHRIALEDHTTTAVRLRRQRLAVEQDGTTGRFFLTEQQAQKGRFTTAGRADHRAKLALFHLQIDALQHHVVAVLLPDVFDVDKTHPRPPSAHGKQALCSWRSARSISHASKVIQMT